MAVSILNLQESGSRAERLSERILYHLSLDRSFAYICPDIKKRELFMSVLANLTDDKNEILYRQEIIKDFSREPDLLERLMELSSRFEELRVYQKTAGREEYRLNAARTSSSDSSKNILRSQALCLKRALLFVKAYGELLANFDLRSSGLKFFHKSCKEIYENPDFRELINLCSKYEDFSSNEAWNFKFVMNEEGRIKEYSLIDHKYIHVTDPELKKKGFSLFKKAEEAFYPCERLLPIKNGQYESLAISALNDVSYLFGKISEQIFEKFGSLKEEFIFYYVALKYINILSEKKAPIFYPTFSEKQCIKVKKLYDLYLLMSKPVLSNVVPNDFVMDRESGGLLVFGDNGSGKTVYLRSVGTMQILAQAGLPIPCESAEIPLFSQIATQFSESEKEFCEGNDAGRFEQEVRELAVMVDTLKEGALVLLNETFQSTAYAEGAEGLCHLLKYFGALNIRWVLVSHLNKLEKMFEPDEVTVLRTSPGHKISK